MVRKNDRTDVIPVRTPARRPSDGALDVPEPAAAETPPACPSAPAVEHPCPHCGAELVDHDAPEGTPKHNAWHCSACGGCFVHRGSAWYVRAGHAPPAGWAGGTLSGGEP